MPDIVLKDRLGELQTYAGVYKVKLNTADGGVQLFTAGEPEEKTVDLDFSGGDMEVTPSAGKLLTKLGIPVPPNLNPSNIAKDVEIAGIVGTHEGGGTIVDGVGNLKFATGTFKTGTVGVYRQSIEHGLGVMPDFVMVYLDETIVTMTQEQFLDKAPFQCAWGFHSKFSSTFGVAGHYNNTGLAPTSTTAFLDVYTSKSHIHCPDDETFAVGFYESDGMTRGLFGIDTTYRWIAIAGMGSVAVSDDVRYVTFRNESTGEEKVKAVATGDDCVDVVAKGLWATPTQASDQQYHYTFYGWGTEPGGAADANILKNITQDKTVYAIFTKTLRTYTITYNDEDGSFLHSETLSYGSMPSYVPTKTGSTFSRWTPTPVAVTGDASYIAIWENAVGGSCGDNATWTLNFTDGVLTISGTGEMLNYSTASAIPWYSHRTSIVAVIIEDGISHIGDRAFYQCALTSISIPDSVTSIGTSAFGHCNSLESIDIPNGVTTISNNCFASCKALNSVIIPIGVTFIDTAAFSGCTGLMSVTLPNGLARIGNFAFSGCSYLRELVIPGTVKSIGRYAFQNCSSLIAIFEAPTGWYVTTTEGAATGTSVNVTADASPNATYQLVITYCTYFWYRSG